MWLQCHLWKTLVFQLPIIYGQVSFYESYCFLFLGCCCCLGTAAYLTVTVSVAPTYTAWPGLSPKGLLDQSGAQYLEHLAGIHHQLPQWLGPSSSAKPPPAPTASPPLTAQSPSQTHALYMRALMPSAASKLEAGKDGGRCQCVPVSSVLFWFLSLWPASRSARDSLTYSNSLTNAKVFGVAPTMSSSLMAHTRFPQVQSLNSEENGRPSDFKSYD